MRSFVGVMLVVLVGVGLWGYRSCSSHVIDEKVFYSGNGLELKVVTAFENLPLHFTGNVFRIQCRSVNTARLAPTTFSKQGWQSYAPIFNGLHSLAYTSQSSMDIGKLAELAKSGYQITDDLTMIVESGSGVAVTFNGCASFARWGFESVAEDLLIATSAEFEKCQTNLQESQEWPHIQQLIKQSGSIAKACQYAKFEGSNKPLYKNFEATKSGTAQFAIESAAFKGPTQYLITTSDFGKSWILTPLDSEVNKEH